MFWRKNTQGTTEQNLRFFNKLLQWRTMTLLFHILSLTPADPHGSPSGENIWRNFFYVFQILVTTPLNPEWDSFCVSEGRTYAADVTEKSRSWGVLSDSFGSRTLTHVANSIQRSRVGTAVKQRVAFEMQCGNCGMPENCIGGEGDLMYYGKLGVPKCILSLAPFEQEFTL